MRLSAYDLGQNFATSPESLFLSQPPSLHNVSGLFWFTCLVFFLPVSAIFNLACLTSGGYLLAIFGSFIFWSIRGATASFCFLQLRL